MLDIYNIYSKTLGFCEFDFPDIISDFCNRMVTPWINQ